MQKKNPAAMSAHDSVKALLANIRFQSDEHPVKTLVVTSSVPGEGKSTICVELAKSMASSGKRVLLVEANLRNPSLDAIISGKRRERRLVGYCDVLANRLPLGKAIFRLKRPNMYFLDSGKPSADPADIFAEEGMAKMVARLRDDFDYVVFDTPALAPCVDAAVLAHIADGTILVLRPNMPLTSELSTAADELAKAKAKVLGICENNLPTR